ncbi:hypothetical protein [Frigoribacterium faeni]|uniref:Lysophospholipase L1-like esterase n=1 Tax=Frigoribacterium faeni TaxID=145483 RepID=A0A7W3PH31_9MICO|nr:hypothetical protein [Frigoribacterium faeni]MBA8811875.1 lysophospholipase L1-like esterase [Frigoribacterium faeni]GEK84589.1 hypothetical protein FFA01_28980 [Frigoribacterium faeni]
MVTIPPRGQHPLRLAAGLVHLVSFFFRRADQSGDIYPVDASRGVVAGDSPERILVLGERGEINLGVVTNELSIAAFVAREHQRVTGRGSHWAISTLSRDSLADGPAAASRHAADLARTDLVVVMAGISDCLRLVSAGTWETHLRATLDALFRQLPRDARVVVAEIPPLENAGSLTRPARIAAGHRASLVNRRTRVVAAEDPRVVVAPFPADLTDRLWVPQSREERYTRTYSIWSRAVVAAVPLY